MDHVDRTNEIEQQIERISKHYQPNITSGFNIDQFRFIRSLGEGMNGAVSKLIFFGTLSSFRIKLVSKNRIFLTDPKTEKDFFQVNKTSCMQNNRFLHIGNFTEKKNSFLVQQIGCVRLWSNNSFVFSLQQLGLPCSKWT